MNLKKHLSTFLRNPRARAVSLIFLVHGLLVSSYYAQVPVFKSFFELNDSELGNVLLGLPLGVIGITTISGWILEKAGAWKSIIISFLLYCVMIILVILSESYWAFFVNIFLMGLSMGLFVVGGNTLAARIEKTDNIMVMGTCNAAFCLGAMVGAPISGLAITYHFPAEYQIGIIIAIFVILIFLNKNHFLSIQSNSESSNGVTFGLPNRELWLYILIGMGFVFVEGMVADFGAVYLEEEVGMSKGKAPLGYSACAFAMMIIRINGDVLVPKYGNRRLLFASSLVSIFGIALLIFFQTPVIGVLSFAIIGCGVGLSFPLLATLAANTKGFSDGAGVSIFTMFIFIALIMEPPLLGGIAERLSLEWGVGMMGVLCLLGGLLSLKVKN